MRHNCKVASVLSNLNSKKWQIRKIFQFKLCRSMQWMEEYLITSLLIINNSN